MSARDMPEGMLASLASARSLHCSVICAHTRSVRSVCASRSGPAVRPLSRPVPRTLGSAVVGNAAPGRDGAVERDRDDRRSVRDLKPTDSAVRLAGRSLTHTGAFGEDDEAVTTGKNPLGTIMLERPASSPPAITPFALQPRISAGAGSHSAGGTVSTATEGLAMLQIAKRRRAAVTGTLVATGIIALGLLPATAATANTSTCKENPTDRAGKRSYG